MSKAKEIIISLLESAGITVNGDELYDIHVHNEGFYKRVLTEGSLGLGESYVEGWWDVEFLDQFFHKILVAHLDKKIKGNWKLLFFYLRSILFNQQTRSRADKVASYHYDVGNDLYQSMLGSTMAYTCGYWRTAAGQTIIDPDLAQEAKFNLVCRKLKLKVDQEILDIGGGWGSFAKYAVINYGVKVTVIVNSQEQYILGKQSCSYLGESIKFLLQDYRDDFTGLFDHIISLGMFEHVGYKNYSTYMKLVATHLKDDGLFLLHTIGGNYSTKHINSWLEKYIFPNSMLPSIKQIGAAIENIFVMEDWHNFGPDYDKTLMWWFKNFEDRKELWSHESYKYDKKFYRMWTYYLLSCAGAFRARDIQLWQIVLSKNGLRGGYRSIR